MLRVCLGHAGRIQAEFGENSRRIQGEFRLNSQRMHLLRFAACLILIVVGVGEVWGQSPVEITTAEEKAAGTLKLYLIQSYSNEAFYMRNNSRNSANALNTSNIVTTNSEFFFMDGDVIEGTQYYYIVHKETGKYVYIYEGTTAKYQNAPAANATDEVKNTYRFKIVKNSSRDAYNIIPINQTNSLHKTDGNSVGTDIQLSGVDNDRSCWNFVAKGNYTKPSVPFIPYTANGTKAYYYLQNNKYIDYYLIPGDTYVTTNTKASENEQNMMWYFKKAPASDNDDYIDYYYIVHVETGKYLHLLQNKENSDNAFNLIDYNSNNDDWFLYIVVRGSVEGETHESSNAPTFCIAPKKTMTTRVENTISLCRLKAGDAGGTNYTNAGVFKERGNNNFTHWNFETAKIICANPVFTEENGNITLSCETDGSEIYYTENGDDPTDDGVTHTKYTNQSWSASSQHRIKAYAKLENDNTDDSNSDVITLLNKPDVTVADGTYTYKGTAWEPAVTVSIDETTAPTSPTATYTVEYSNNTNVGTASVTVTDADANDNWYIWNAPTATFTITKAPLTVTADDKNVTYGSAVPEYTISYSGFVNDEDATNLTTVPTATCGYAPTSTVSSSPYTITVSGGEATNYSFSYVNGTLTVNPAAVTVTADNKEKTYGESDPTLTATITGLKNGDAVNVISYTLSRETGEAYGNYTITPSGEVAQGNYTVTYVTGTLSINRIGVTLTANSRNTDVYDGTLKTVTGYTCSMDGVTFTGVSASGSGTDASTYPVSFNNDVIGTIDESGNYVVAVATPGTLTINPKTLTITPDADQYKGFGDDDPVLTYTYSGLVEGDEIAFNGALGREEGEDVGTYEINLYNLTSANSNYVLALTEEPVVYFTIMKSVGNESMAEGFKLEIGAGGDIILKDGETVLTKDIDYEIESESPSASGKYTERTVSGSGSYTGSFTFTNANVSFQTDANELEWSATFVAEPIGGGDADDTKGHALPDGMKAFIITDIDGDWAIPEQLTYIPEGVPVLLVSDKESGGFIVEDATPTDEQKIKGTQKEANMLKVTTSTTHFDIKTIFLLYKNEFIYNMSGDLAAGKVYLNPPSGSSPAPSRLRIKKKDDTGIEDTHFLPLTSHLSDVWYTLDGRKLNGKPVQKGLYIIEGKKIFIK